MVSIIVIITITGLYFFARKSFPLNSSQIEKSSTLEGRDRKYQKYDLVQFGLSIPLIIAFSYLIFKLLEILSGLRFKDHSNLEFLIEPEALMIFIPSFFIGILITWTFLIIGLKRKLGSEWTDYIAHNNLKYKFDYGKFSRYTFIGFSIFVSLLSVFLLDWYTIFKSDKIIINEFANIGIKEYGYNEIIQIKSIDRIKAPAGNIVEDSHYIIEFSDGNSWNSRDQGFSDYNQDGEIIEFVINQTDTEIIYLDFNE